MELIFNESDVEKLLIEKAQSMGIQANKVNFHASYGRFDRAEVYFEEEQTNPASERPT